MPLCAATGRNVTKVREIYRTRCLRGTRRCPNQKCYHEEAFMNPRPNAIGFTPNRRDQVKRHCLGVPQPWAKGPPSHKPPPCKA